MNTKHLTPRMNLRFATMLDFEQAPIVTRIMFDHEAESLNLRKPKFKHKLAYLFMLVIMDRCETCPNWNTAYPRSITLMLPVT